MAWLTQRAGDWSALSGDVSSPWHDGGAQAAANRVPRGGAGTDAAATGAGDPVRVRHALTVDGAFSCGHSPPPSPWDAPIDLSARGGGLFRTKLPTGLYRASYYIKSTYGSTSVGDSETEPVSITQDVSGVRVAFLRPPPGGSTYVLVLTEAGGAAGTGRVYCREILGPVVDLNSSDLWENTFTGGGAAQGTDARPFAAASAPPATRDAAALVIESTGSMAFADGSLLTIRGDWLIESPDGSTAIWATFEGTGDYVFNASLASGPASTTYRVVWQGHGKFAWTA